MKEPILYCARSNSINKIQTYPNSWRCQKQKHRFLCSQHLQLKASHSFSELFLSLCQGSTAWRMSHVCESAWLFSGGRSTDVDLLQRAPMSQLSKPTTFAWEVESVAIERGTRCFPLKNNPICVPDGCFQFNRSKKASCRQAGDSVYPRSDSQKRQHKSRLWASKLTTTFLLIIDHAEPKQWGFGTAWPHFCVYNCSSLKR